MNLDLCGLNITAQKKNKQQVNRQVNVLQPDQAYL